MKHYDLIVAGGGLSGVAAAVSAAREGLAVLLIERAGCLGGAMSNCQVYPFMKNSLKDPERTPLSCGIFVEMIERGKAYDPSSTDTRFKPEYFKLLLDDMVTEAGVEVLFHSSVCGLQTEGRRLLCVEIATACEKLVAKADFFIDATGDGNLFTLAGCAFQLGRESDGFCQPMTTCFRLSGVDIALFRKDIARLNELYQEARKEGRIQNPREDILWFDGIGEGVLHFNTTRIIKHDPTNIFDLSHAEMQARRQIYEMVNFLKAHSEAFAHSTLVAIASDIGVRESRKLRGMHVLTAEELKELTPFEDSIALGSYDIDIHNPTGSGTSHYYFKPGEYYRIPYRVLLPREYDNLLVAGRCVSVTHEAQASIRIMPICACLGEAAGTAAAIAHHTNTNAHTLDIKNLQEKLAAHGAKF